VTAPPLDVGLPVAGLLLAAGAGRRMGGPKALVEVDGRLLVERAVAVLADGGCAPVVVVLGAGADEVRRSADLHAVRVVDNPNWAEGQAGSLRIGLVGVADTDTDTDDRIGAVVVALVDQPGIPAAIVARLVQTWRNGAGPAVVAAYDGRPRNPVLLAREVWADVAAAVEGDEGARAWLQQRALDDPNGLVLVECGDLGNPADLDTLEDLRAYVGGNQNRDEPAGLTGTTNRSRS
jgi:nicotine blue oxidoreductase